MGYELHITRREDWYDEGNDISLKEWLDFIEASPDMRLDQYAEATVGETTLRYEAPGIAVWTGWSRNGLNRNQAWFYFERGAIEVKNPDVEIRRKMFEVAQHFGARVQGDEGETYDQNGEALGREPVSSWPYRKPWWKLW